MPLIIIFEATNFLFYLPGLMLCRVFSTIVIPIATFYGSIRLCKEKSSRFGMVLAILFHIVGTIAAVAKYTKHTVSIGSNSYELTGIYGFIDFVILVIFIILICVKLAKEQKNKSTVNNTTTTSQIQTNPPENSQQLPNNIENKKFCPMCGTAHDQDSLYCTNCGTKI